MLCELHSFFFLLFFSLPRNTNLLFFPFHLPWIWDLVG